MITDRIEGDWKQIKGEAKLRWARLTDDDITAIAGKRDKLLGKLQARYRYAKARAEKEVVAFADGLKQTVETDVKPKASTGIPKGSKAKIR